MDSYEGFDTRNLRVLVVEDDIDDFYVVKEFIEKSGPKNIELFNVKKLKDAIDFINFNDLDAVLLDLNLEDSSGLETLISLNVFFTRVPVIVLTGIEEDEVGKQAIQKGAIDYIPKIYLSPYLLNRTILYGIERHRLLKDVTEKAYKDTLTGLSNREALYNQLKIFCDQSERNGSKFALLMVDLDGFKLVNDKLGHLAGDNVLIQVARRLRDSVRKTDYVFRLAGDEFILLMTNFNSVDELEVVIEKLRENISQPITVDTSTGPHLVDVSCSIGVVLWKKGMVPDDLINIADGEMYKSKRSGKNRVSFF